MHAGAALANACWLATALPEKRRFDAALLRPRETQESLLVQYLRAAAATEIGRQYRFGTIASVAEFQARIPISRYDDIAPAVQGIAAGRQAVLTADAVERLVPSSGSTAAVKLIPFTRAVAREFSRAVDAWAADLFTSTPSLMRGPSYWSISPSTGFGQELPPSAIPIGFAADTAYLGTAQRRLANAVMAVPGWISQVQQVDEFLYATVRLLASQAELRLISVWHPSFLERLFETWEHHADRIAHDVERGTLTPPGETCGTTALPLLTRRLQPDAARARVLRRARNVLDVWPSLGLISCWADGPASGAAARLATSLPGVPVQSKGLVATEGVVSILYAGLHPIAIRSHFVELLDDDGRPHLLDDVTEGATYDVVLTTGGGLYRYRLGDRVRVDGFVGGTPSIRFVGRSDRVSDWCGEKISEGFVASVIDDLFPAGRPPFTLVAPEWTPAGLSYTLFVELRQPGDTLLATRFEQALRRNPHYAWCVDLGQLRPSRAVTLRSGADSIYVAACAAGGQRLGDIKPALLRSETGWQSILPCHRAVDGGLAAITT